MNINIEKLKLLSEFSTKFNLSKKEYLEFENDFEEMMEYAANKCAANPNEAIRLGCLNRIGERLFFYVDVYVDIKNDFIEVTYKRVPKKAYKKELEKRKAELN